MTHTGRERTDGEPCRMSTRPNTSRVHLTELRALAENATPGPWFTVGLPWNNTGVPWVVAGAEDPHAAQYVCDVENVTEEDQRPTMAADAQFIAACDPDTVLALVSVAEAAQALAHGAVGGGKHLDGGIVVRRDRYTELRAALEPFSRAAEGGAPPVPLGGTE